MNNVDIVREFIRQHDHGVLATTTPDGQPECGIVEFAETPELEIIFDTSTTYRKYKNLEHSPRVALAIGSREANTGLQYEGSASRLQEEALEVANKSFSRNALERNNGKNSLVLSITKLLRAGFGIGATTLIQQQSLRLIFEQKYGHGVSIFTQVLRLALQGRSSR